MAYIKTLPFFINLFLYSNWGINWLYYFNATKHFFIEYEWGINYGARTTYQVVILIVALLKLYSEAVKFKKDREQTPESERKGFIRTLWDSFTK